MSFPKVAVLVPTSNRKSFLPIVKYQYEHQDYPTDKLVMIVLDDSDVSNESCFSDSTRVIHYHHETVKRTIGDKRNRLNALALEDPEVEYIVWFDDDDYYPTHRISFAISAMMRTGKKISGSSLMLIAFPDTPFLYMTRPADPEKFPAMVGNSSLAYHRSYLETHAYRSTDTKCEEFVFLDGYQVSPFLQLESAHFGICISHNHNTVSKEQLRGKMQLTPLRWRDIIADSFLLDFYEELFARAPPPTTKKKKEEESLFLFQKRRRF